MIKLIAMQSERVIYAGGIRSECISTPIGKPPVAVAYVNTVDLAESEAQDMLAKHTNISIIASVVLGTRAPNGFRAAKKANKLCWSNVD